MKDIQKAFEVIKDRPISEFWDFIDQRYKDRKKSGTLVDYFTITRTYAEMGLALHDFAEHIRRENAKN